VQTADGRFVDADGVLIDDELAEMLLALEPDEPQQVANELTTGEAAQLLHGDDEHTAAVARRSGRGSPLPTNSTSTPRSAPRRPRGASSCAVNRSGTLRTSPQRLADQLEPGRGVDSTTTFPFCHQVVR